MRPVNYPYLARFIPTSRFRTGISLFGVIDGSNTSFTVAPEEKFVHDPPYIQIRIFYNGIRLFWPDDYSLDESEGDGTGYDMVVLAVAPKPGDKLFADYIVTQ